MKKYLTLISLFIFALLLIGCNTHEHYYEKQYIDPTCTEAGTIVYTCECGDSYTETVSEPLGHEYGDWEVIQNPTMNSEGTKEQKCIRCNNTNIEQIGKREYPDLGGYTIKIAVPYDTKHNYDPFYFDYSYMDKEARQKAMREVEEKFNCIIEYVDYPKTAEYGPLRWNYLLDGINNKTIEYDFCQVSNAVIPDFVKSGGIVNLNEYYLKYGQDIMNNVQTASSIYKNDVYAICDARNHYTMIMVYDLVLFRQLCEVDPTLKEPAQIYLEGNWTHSEFLRYCEQVQNAMEELHGAKGKPGSEEQEYYALSGWPTYFWAGLATSSEEPLLDINNMEVNYTTERKIKSINLVKDLYEKSYLDPKFSLTGHSDSFNDKKALIECGFLYDYLLSHSSTIRFENSDFGFVLYPREDEIKFSDVKIPLWDSRYYIMINQNNYNNYGKECSSEYIYWAFSEYIKLTNQYSENQASNFSFDTEEIIYSIRDSESSKEMWEYLYTKTNNNEVYYDPIFDYSYFNTLFSSLNDFPTYKSLHTYIMGVKDKTWEQLTFWVVRDLKNRLNQRYG